MASSLIGHDVQTVPQAGWAGIKNGKLLRLAEVRFDVFITADRNLSFQQNLGGLGLSVVVLGAPSNRYEDLLPLVPRVLEAFGKIRPGEVVAITV